MRKTSLCLLSSPTFPSPSLLSTHREGDVGRGKSQTGQHTGEEGQEEGQREADGGGSQTGLSAEEEGTESCRDWVSRSAAMLPPTDRYLYDGIVLYTYMAGYNRVYTSRLQPAIYYILYVCMYYGRLQPAIYTVCVYIMADRNLLYVQFFKKQNL